MKILMCNSFYYIRGGAERCFFDTMKLLEDHGHKVIPFSMRDKRNFPTIYDEPYFISHVDFPSHLGNESSFKTKLKLAERVLYSREARRKIESLIQTEQPDIAHIHGIAHEMSPSILPAIKEAGIPIVQTLHDYKLLCPNTSFVSHEMICERCKKHRYYNVVRYRCKRDSLSASLLAGVEMYFHKAANFYEGNVNLFISPSLFLKDKLAEYGIKSPVIHLPNYVNSSALKPNYAPEDYFVFSGRLTPVKGIATLLAAMREVNESHLYIAGTGEMEKQLQTYVTEQGIANVTFLGHLNMDDLTSLIQRALFTLVPSEWYENYPMTVLESFACGTPVIGTNIGGIPELIQDGENGLLFEPGNTSELIEKIISLLRNRELAVRMGQKGRQQVERNNSPERHYQRTIQIYKQLTQDTNDWVAGSTTKYDREMVERHQ